MTHDATAAIIANLDLDILAWDISDAIAKSEQDGLDTFAMDEIKAELPAFLAGCLRRAAEANADPDEINPETGLPHRFDDAPRAKSHGGVMHVDTDGSPMSTVPFGHKAEMGPERCARCWELANGAERRDDPANGRRRHDRRWS